MGKEEFFEIDRYIAIEDEKRVRELFCYDFDFPDSVGLKHLDRLASISRRVFQPTNAR